MKSPITAASGAVPSQSVRPYLIDVSRLVWRYWSRRLPTGIDRVCLAYLDHFRGRARAVIQRRGHFFVLSEVDTDRLADLFLNPGPASRRRLVWTLAKAFARLPRQRVKRGQVYLNVGHTGLNEPTLAEWIERHALKPIYLVHDLIPLTHPQFCRAGEAERHAKRMDTVLRTASGVIGNSQATLDDLATYARDSGQPMPPSVAAWISGPPPSPPQQPSAPAKPYFVVLGTVEGRKNHRLLLDVWSRLLSQDDEDIPTLIVIGQRGWEASAEIEALSSPERYRGHVQFCETCGDAELASLLAGSRALLMPSYAEGFGLPVIEALQLGTPVIASDLPVFRELAGDIVQLIDPDRPNLWQDAILDYASDGGDRPAQLRRMKGYSAPDWPSHFAIVEDWTGKLGGQPSIRPFDRRRV